MPFFVTRRIIEGLGLGLARRAARKLVPVVLTLGSGPSSLPRKFSRRRLKLPRQPGRGASLALASVILALGACPSRNNFPGDGRSFRDSRGKPAPSLARALSFWRWGLARRASRKIFPGDGQSFCDSLPRARFRRFGAGGWPVAAMAVLSTGSGQMARYLNSGCVLSRIRRLSAVKPSHFYRGLADLQLYQGRPAAVAVLSSLGGARCSRSLP